uniref:SnRK1-interacting protein 1 n=1 Tax=Hordeum vulgare TaxID=4513 RepID=Q9LEH5_HORVU|nr:SnRK1-interacting protein 1 [Hordeum vulgare subsp. vulgare]
MAPGALARLVIGRRAASPLLARPFAAKARASQRPKEPEPLSEEDDDFTSGGEAAPIPTEGISKPLAGILKELGKKVPESLLKTRLEDNGFTLKYIPWHLANKVLNAHAPEWSGEVRNIVYSSDGKSVSVVYRVTLYGTDAEIYREATGTASVEDKGYGDPVQKAEGMAFRRACARLGLGLHLYHEDMS